MESKKLNGVLYGLVISEIRIPKEYTWNLKPWSDSSNHKVQIRNTKDESDKYSVKVELTWSIWWDLWGSSSDNQHWNWTPGNLILCFEQRCVRTHGFEVKVRTRVRKRRTRTRRTRTLRKNPEPESEPTLRRKREPEPNFDFRSQICFIRIEKIMSNGALNLKRGHWVLKKRYQ